jgi:hypothetical protein
MRVGLVSCSKAKLDHRAPASELYSSSALFRGASCCVKRSCDRWYILSARHHLVRPEEELDPYNQTLNDSSVTERRRWSQEVLSRLGEQLGDVRGVTFEVHAGASYLNFGLVDGLVDRGAKVESPVGGMPQGKRLQFYKRAGCL